jgi:ribosome-associated protein
MNTMVSPTPGSPAQTAHIKLDQFLKHRCLAQSGGEAKLLILNGEVVVNGVVETRRGRKLIAGDQVSVGDLVLEVQTHEVKAVPQ